MRHLLFVVLVTLVSAGTACAANPVFTDNFNGSAVNLNNWNTHFRWGDVIINNELQAYTPNNFKVSGGTIKIQARIEHAIYGDQLMQYTSGVLTSYYQRIYGKWVIRCKMPSAGKGFWPAFWLYPAESGTSQTIIPAEWFGAFPTTMTTLYAEQNGATHYQYPQGNYAGQWHIYAVEWRPNFVSITIDGIEVNRYDGPTQAVPMYMILNFAVASQDPVGPPDGLTVFPADFEIDYIKIYP